MLIFITELIYYFAVCVFAMSKGSLEERLAGAWLALNIALYTAFALTHSASPTLSLINDGIFSLGLLPLAMIFVSWGVGLMTIIQACSFGVQAFYLLTDKPVDLNYINLTNGAAILVTTTLLVSTLWSIRRGRTKPPSPNTKLQSA